VEALLKAFASRRIGRVIAAIALGLMLATTSLSAANVDLVFIDGRPGTELPAEERDGVIYCSLRALAEGLGAEAFWQAPAHRLVLRLGGQQLEAVAETPLVTLGDRALNLPTAPLWRGADVWIPIEPFTAILERMISGRMIWDPAQRTLAVESSPINVSGMRIEPRANGTLVILETTRRFDRIETMETAPHWLHLSILGARANQVVLGATEPRGDVRAIEIYQYEDSAQISFLLSSSVLRHELKQREAPGGIVLSLWRDEAREADTTSVAPDVDRWIIDTVIIDAGHGGRDPGTVGRAGLAEKDVVLDVARRLRNLLESRLGVAVVMTRDSDEFVRLRDRSQIAVRNGGKLFISIHANAARSRRASGAETYFLSEAKTEAAKAVAARENAVLEFEEPLAKVGALDAEDFLLRDVRAILTDMASDQHLKESQELARLVQGEFRATTSLADRGVKQAGFYVMLGTVASMPSVLVEVGFLSNRFEEKQLRSRDFRQGIAEALLRAVAAFKERRDRELTERFSSAGE
jgi:N-acetylmuramoyl-L-alanine amidase